MNRDAINSTSLNDAISVQSLFCDLRNYYIDKFDDSDHENDKLGRMVLINRNCVLFGELIKFLVAKHYITSCLITRSLYETLVALTFILQDPEKIDIRSRRYYISQYQTDIKLCINGYYNLTRGTGMLDNNLKLTAAGAKYVNVFRKEFRDLFFNTPNYLDSRKTFNKLKVNGCVDNTRFKFYLSSVVQGDSLKPTKLDTIKWYAEDKSWTSLQSLVSRGIGKNSLSNHLYDCLYRPLCSLNHFSVVRDEVILCGPNNDQLAFYEGVYDPSWFISILNMELDILSLLLSCSKLESVNQIIKKVCVSIPNLRKWFFHRFSYIDTHNSNIPAYQYFNYIGRI